MPGLATVQASSAAYATIPNQSSTALNTGWVLDQRLDSASSTGGFVSNGSPTSSGYIFTSSGDGTTGTGNSFWSLGRATWILQGTTNFYGVVQTATVAAGVTTVGLSSASVTPTAGLSTGVAFTTVAAATQTGQFHWIPNQNNAWDLGSALRNWRTGYFGTNLIVGTTTATAGLIRVPNNSTGGIIGARNAANTADAQVLGFDASDVVQIGSGGHQVKLVAGTVLVGSSFIQFGTNPAGSGPVRLVNAAYINGRNAANNADRQVIGINASDNVLIGDATALLDFNYAVTAIGAGAVAILDKVGGSGPATAGQNSWLKVFINGTASFLPVWR